MSLSTVIPLSSCGNNIVRENFLENQAKEKLQAVGISPSVIPNSMRSIQLVIYNRVVNGVGFRNVNGGIECFSTQLIDMLYQQDRSLKQYRSLQQRKALERNMKNFRFPLRKEAEKLLNSEEQEKEMTDCTIMPFSTVTLKSPGVLAFPKKKGKRTKKCCLFTNFLDYLSYKTILMNSGSQRLEDCDCLVMNNVVNFSTFVLDSEEYEHVLCFFPKTDIGNTMFMTLRSRRKSAVVNMSNIYKDSLSINEYVISKTMSGYEQKV